MHKLVNGIPIELTPEEEAQYLLESEELIQQVAVYEKTLFNRNIIQQLKDIDDKTIRALREGNQERLNSLEAEATQLRMEFIK